MNFVHIYEVYIVNVLANSSLLCPADTEHISIQSYIWPSDYSTLAAFSSFLVSTKSYIVTTYVCCLGLDKKMIKKKKKDQATVKMTNDHRSYYLFNVYLTDIYLGKSVGREFYSSFTVNLQRSDSLEIEPCLWVFYKSSHAFCRSSALGWFTAAEQV